MKQYSGPFFAFSFSECYPHGGIADCDGIYETLEEAKEKVFAEMDNWYVAVVDNGEWEIIYDINRLEKVSTET